MVQFLNTSATSYRLEELIKNTREHLIIISPFLKFNDRIKELLTDLDRLKIDIRIVYGKNELAPKEINWLRSLEFVRTSFCQNLHAKCYLNEQAAIITSMNLYDFSQVNNNEMGVFIEREAEPNLYRDTYEEAQRLIRVSEPVRLAADAVVEGGASNAADDSDYDRLTTAKLAKARGLSTQAATDRLVEKGFLELDGQHHKLTEAGRQAGGESAYSKRTGAFVLWPKDLQV